MSVVCVLMYLQVNTRVTHFLVNWLALYLSDPGKNMAGGAVSFITYYFFRKQFQDFIILIYDSDWQSLFAL